MKELLKKLVNVKTIVTLLVTIIFCYLAVVKSVTGEQFLTIFTVIISFYFGTQHEKKTQEIEEKKGDE